MPGSNSPPDPRLARARALPRALRPPCDSTGPDFGFRAREPSVPFTRKAHACRRSACWQAEWRQRRRHFACCEAEWRHHCRHFPSREARARGVCRHSPSRHARMAATLPLFCLPGDKSRRVVAAFLPPGMQRELPFAAFPLAGSPSASIACRHSASQQAPRRFHCRLSASQNTPKRAPLRMETIPSDPDALHPAVARRQTTRADHPPHRTSRAARNHAQGRAAPQLALRMCVLATGLPAHRPLDGARSRSRLP